MGASVADSRGCCESLNIRPMEYALFHLCLQCAGFIEELYPDSIVSAPSLSGSYILLAMAAAFAAVPAAFRVYR